MSNIPNLNNLIKAIECAEYKETICKQCPYNYQYFDEHGDYSFWTCDEEKIKEHSLFYLKLYQYLIKEKENGRI